MKSNFFSLACRASARATCVAALKTAAVTGLFVASSAVGSYAQQARTNATPVPHTRLIPASSSSTPADAGKSMHTNITLLSTGGQIPVKPVASPSELPPYPGYAYETPASLACVYAQVPTINACNPNLLSRVPVGGSGSIAIVDAYDDPEAAADLAYFSDQFGLPFSPSQFQVFYESGFPPSQDYTGGWEIEESLDIEYAHAMAPKATIYLVEADSNYDSDLYAAVVIASNLVQCGSTATCPTGSTGKGEVSMSWAGGEYPGETDADTTFTTPGVVYLAASGDSPGTVYPASSPNVIAVGGSSIARNPTTGNYMYQVSWSEAGGGPSFYEPIPVYQKANAAVVKLAGASRATPDFSFDANPDSGVWVYDTFGDTDYPWYTVGGTSVATPAMAGILNAAGHFSASSAAELTAIYSSSTGFLDVRLGVCGPYVGYVANVGYDFCTGVGTPIGYGNK